MRTPPRWFVAAGLLGSAAVLFGIGVRQVSLRCAGQGIFDATAACRAAMEASWGVTSPGALTSVAMLLLAVAWLVVLPMVPVGRLVRGVLALPSVLVGAAAVAVGFERVLTVSQLVAIDVVAAVALLTLFGVRLEMSNWDRARYAIVLVGATANSFLHFFGDFVVSKLVTNGAWWDQVPPDAGYGTVVFLLLAALVTAGWGLLERRRAHVGPAAVMAAG